MGPRYRIICNFRSQNKSVNSILRYFYKKFYCIEFIR
jgi:hypothetical protein